MNNKIVSFDGGKKKDEVPPLTHVKIVYTDGEVEIIRSDSWGSASELEGFIVFFRSIDKEDSLLLGFRNQSLIKRIDLVDEDGSLFN